MRILLVMATAVLIGSACQVSVHVGKGPPPIHGDAEFGDVVLATEIDPVSKAPVTPVTEFRSDAPTMHATIHAKNAKAGEFSFEWKRDGQRIGEITLTLPDVYDNWVSATVNLDTGAAPGTGYLVEASYNGTVISTASFRVIDVRSVASHN